jgi:hypothetical protein
MLTLEKDVVSVIVVSVKKEPHPTPPFGGKQVPNAAPQSAGLQALVAQMSR